MKLDDFAAELAPYLPPAFGAFVGVVNAKNQTPKQRLIGFAIGFGLSVFVAPALGEWWALGPKAIVALGVFVAVIGGDIVGGLLAASASFKADPLSAFKSWWSAWRSGGQQ
jgi:hypothetical protein